MFEGQEAGLAQILDDVTGLTGWSTVLAAGAVISIFSVTLVTMYGQTRILFAMGRDGLLPSMFAKVNPKSMTPVNNTIIVAIVVTHPGRLHPAGLAADMVSIGTLTAFIVVSIGVIILRVREPDLPRGFKVPLYPVTPDPVDPRLRLHPVQPALVHLARVRRAGCSSCWSFYLLWGRHHSALNDGGDGVIASAAPGVDDVEIVTPPQGRCHDRRRRIPGRQGGHVGAEPRRRGGQDAQDVAVGRHRRAQAVDHAVAGAHRRRVRRSTQTSSPPTPPPRRAMRRDARPRRSRSASTSTRTGRRPAACSTPSRN